MKTYFIDTCLTPTVVEAGDSVEFTIKLALGKDFSASNSCLILDFPAYLGQDRPSRFDQETGGYVEVFCDNADIAYKCQPWDMEIADFPTRQKTSFKGMAQRLLVIDFLSGEAQEGDNITIKWGWTRNGFSIGCKVTMLALKPKFMNVIDVRYFSDKTKGLPDFGRDFKGFDRPVPDVEIPLEFRVVSRKPEKLRYIQGLKESALLIHDRFSNICPDASPCELANVSIKMSQNSLGAYVTKEKNVDLESSMPLTKTPSMKNIFEGMNVYWGDLHSHSSNSNDCIEREKQRMTPGDNFQFARDAARLDFHAVTDHHQPWDVERNKIGEVYWNNLLEDVAKYDEPGRFLAFSGFEYRCQRGDTAVVLNEIMNYAELDNPAMTNISELWDVMNGHDYMTIPHYHNGGYGEPEWFDCPYDGIETIQEIYSCHGAYDVASSIERPPPMIKNRRPERNGKWMLDHGKKYGLCCNSDGHKGNPGMNGLTAVYAPELTKDAIFKAIRNRQVYGTTNARIRLLFTANDNLMGSTLSCTEKSVMHIDVVGEDKFKSVELLCNGELYKRFKPMTEQFEVTLEVDASEASYWYVRAVQVDNEIAWSSPVWFE